MRDKLTTGYLRIAALREQDGDVAGWQKEIMSQAIGGPRLLPVEIDVSRNFHRQLLDSMEEGAPPDGKIKIWGVPIVIREDLPFAEEIVA